MKSALDTQVGGNHYKDMPIQPMEYSMANKLDACQHTIIKYVTRFRQKGGTQDLEKARHVIDMLIEFERKAYAQPAKAANDNQPGKSAKQRAIDSGACLATAEPYLCDLCIDAGHGECAAMLQLTREGKPRA